MSQICNFRGKPILSKYYVGGLYNLHIHFRNPECVTILWLLAASPWDSYPLFAIYRDGQWGWPRVDDKVTMRMTKDGWQGDNEDDQGWMTRCISVAGESGALSGLPHIISIMPWHGNLSTHTNAQKLCMCWQWQSSLFSKTLHMSTLSICFFS